MQLKVLDVVVTLTNGDDVVEVHTDLPLPLHAVAGEEATAAPLVLRFHAPRDTGLEYVETYFDVIPRTVSKRY
jgi:hypothetical protein